MATNLPAGYQAAFEARLQSAKKTVVDGTQVEDHPLRDIIAADKYLRACDVANNPDAMGFRLQRIVPPGAVN